jgi:glucose-1-phosphate thymidylyltransferase
MQYLIDNDIKEKGEYQLTNAMENMKNKGADFYPGKVEEWLDCGNAAATVYTNQRVLEFNKSVNTVPTNIKNVNSIIIQPCFIGENVILENTVIGPHVSIQDGSKIKNSIVKNSIILNKTSIENKVLADSMIGNNVSIKGANEILSIGDFTTIQ